MKLERLCLEERPISEKTPVTVREPVTRLKKSKVDFSAPVVDTGVIKSENVSVIEPFVESNWASVVCDDKFLLVQGECISGDKCHIDLGGDDEIRKSSSGAYGPVRTYGLASYQDERMRLDRQIIKRNFGEAQDSMSRDFFDKIEREKNENSKVIDYFFKNNLSQEGFARVQNYKCLK
jgi:hypothetical protein